MDLDEYKMVRRKEEGSFSLKKAPELADYLHGQTQSIVSTIKKNLRFEIAFAMLFLVFDCIMIILFDNIFFLRLFSILLLVFCLYFLYYLAKLLRYINIQYSLDSSVKEQLSNYIQIISRFKRLYFQLTMVMIPLMLVMAFIAGYLDHDQSGNYSISFSSQTVFIYSGLSVCWIFMMYFITRWYIKRRYGNHLDKLEKLLNDLQQSA